MSRKKILLQLDVLIARRRKRFIIIIHQRFADQTLFLGRWG